MGRGGMMETAPGCGYGAWWVMETALGHGDGTWQDDGDRAR